MPDTIVFSTEEAVRLVVNKNRAFVDLPRSLREQMIAAGAAQFEKACIELGAIDSAQKTRTLVEGIYRAMDEARCR